MCLKNLHLTVLATTAFCVLALVLNIDVAMAVCPAGTASITHSTNINLSWAELCSTAARPSTVRLIVYNYDRDNDLTNMVITETLPAGMNYVAGSASVVAVLDGTAPSISTENISGSTITWTFSGPLDSRRNSESSNWMYIDFEVFRSDEALISSTANYTFSAEIDYDAVDENTSILFCKDTDSSGNQVLPLRQPIPSVSKQGWNVDARQAEGSSTTTVYGNNNDDVIWRLGFTNTGRAPLEDLIFDDTMVPGNMQVNYVCATAAAATAVASANGVGPGACYATYRDLNGALRAVTNSIQDFAVDDPFGNPGNDETTTFFDVLNGRTAYVYLVGKLTADASCSVSRTNTLTNIEWGCEADSPPDGGISPITPGATPGTPVTAITTLTTYYGDVNAALTVNRRLTGTNTTQPVGTKGTMTITITNDTGGSVKFTDTLAYHLRDTLPVEYVMDPTFTPTIAVTSSYGAYAGRVDRITWSNPAPGTFPINTSDSTSYLNNKVPEFTLSSSTSYTDGVTFEDMMRQGDVLTITFRVVLIESNYYDRAANLDVTPEDNTLAAQNTDPDPGQPITLSNTLNVRYDTFCTTQATQTLTLLGNGTANPGINNNIPADPEDLDIAIGGGVFILTNDPTQILTLPVLVTNNGGHQATNHHVFVTFGTTMEVVNNAGCSQVHAPSGTPAVPDEWQPTPFNVWVKDPADAINIPSTASVYECTSPTTIAPGQTVTYNFQVTKTSNAARIALDDLTFRADVVGEITLSNGTPLWFPVPIIRADGELDRANNYSLDAVWARVIGFNLKKTQSGPCNENNPPSYDANGFEEVQIGEECTYFIDTGGWFGFETPGFAYIAVQNIDVVDELEDAPDYGQAYISSTNPIPTSTSGIKNVVLNPAGLLPVTEGWIDWRFNVADDERIEVADEWFRVYVTTRILNDAVDSSAVPNLHGANSHNILNSTFDATFSNNNTGLEETYTLGPGTIGYPNEPIRRVDLTVTEPNILVTKQVCNETLYGTGTGCTTFVDLAADGDTHDSYIYKIVLTNEAASGGVVRAPAYDVTTTDILDTSDLVYVVPFGTDGLDNDGDGLVDGADGNGEGSITDNVVNNGTPATITNSHTHSNALLRINAGASVTFYYRVDPDDRVAPQQQLVNQVSATYDSLEGATGSQTVDLRANSDIGGARVFTSAAATATVQILSVTTQPKYITRLANTPLGTNPQEVSIGEEVEYELRTYLPVAYLRSFVIRDELPAGLRCSKAPEVDLDAAPYNAAGFVPAGKITPTCIGNLVEWNFGDRWLTTKPAGVSLFEFPVRFIGRVENTAGTNNGDVIANGNPATNATVSYINEAGSTVVLNFGQVDILVREPQIALTKTFTVANADADDVLTVTVTATNTGTATAYNLRVLDDLVGLHLTYVGNVSGTDPPNSVDITTLGANRPIFSWNPPNGIAPSATISFTFEVRVDNVVQPHEVLDNTIQARWTSLPGQTTALNSTGLIGADGSATGMRIGVLPNVVDAVNDYQTTAADQVIVPALTMTKTDLTPALVPTIGTHKNFQIEIQLPEGVTNNVLVTDSLNAAGISYLLENNATYDVTYTFQDIATINGLAPNEGSLTAFPADGTSGNAVWDIGTVVTQTENDTAVNAINPVIRINYYARINNDLVTDSGDPLQNSVVVNYTNGETSALETLTDNIQITVVEPVLTVNKAATLVTPAPLSGGSILEYTVTVSNSGTSEAFDVNVVDTLPSELLLYSGYTPTATIGGTAVAGFTATPAGAPGGPLVWGRGNGDNSLDVPTGETLVLTYQTQVQVSTTTTFNNEVWVDWTSLDNGDSFERTGAGCPTVTAPNDYCAGPASVTSNTVDNNSLTKSVASDSYVDSLSTANDATVRIGDTVTYRLTLALGEGLTRSVQVTDVLPSGMTFENMVSISPASGSNFTYTVTTQPIAGDTGTLTWDFGDIANQPSNDNTPNDTLVIEYVAKVLPDAGIIHIATTTLTNTATLHYLDINGIPVVDPTRLQSLVVITVWQPIINQVTKTDRSGRTSPASVTIATDIMNFRLEACNATGRAPAYSVELTDQLASQLDETSIANLVVTAGGSALTAGIDYVYTPPAIRGGTMVFLLTTPVNPGQCLTIDYDIGFHTDFGPQTWSNSATLDAYWSLPAQSGQLYGPVGPAIYAMHNVVNLAPPAKTIVSPAAGEAAIGEEVVYHIKVPAVLKNAAIFDIIITDTLDGNLEYVSATEISGNGYTLIDNSVSPTQVSLKIDQINAFEQAVIELRARVRNLVSANGGGTFTNTATYTYADSSGGATLSGGSDTTTPILIVEPSLALAKSVVNVTNPGNPPVAGDILRYTLDFTAAGGAAGDNFSDAFDLRIDDTLGLGLVYSGNPTVNGAGNIIGVPVTAGNGTTTPQTLLWSFANGNADIDISEGTVVNVTYEVLVLDTVLIGQTLSNSATAQWTSLDGASVYERTGTGTPPLNDYFTGPATTTLTTGDTTTISKTRLQDTFVTADANVRIGDIIDYELRLGLQEGSHDNLVVTDTLPQGLGFAGVVSVNGDSTAPYAAVVPFVHTDISNAAIAVAGDPASGPSTVTWNLGNIVNQADGSTANDEFILVYRARVLNTVLAQVNSTPLTNTVRLDYDTVTGPAVQTDSETITLLQPILTVAKSAVAAGGDSVLVADELVTYTVNITNNGSAPAYDPVLRDIIPVGMRNGTATITMVSIDLLSGSVLTNLAPVYDAATGIATWNFDTSTADQYTIPAGDTLRIVYQVQAESAIGAGLTLANQAQVSLYYSFDDEAVPSQASVTGVREIYGPSNVPTTTLTTAAPDALVKDNPAVTIVAVGEPFTYRITVPGTPQATTLYDVRILDDLTASAADLTFVSVTKISGSQPWTPVNTGTLTQLVIEDTTIGIDIPAGEQIVIDITVRLDDTATNASGLLFNNTASYTYDQVNDDPATQAVGGPDTTADMTIVGPDALTLEKTGPASVQLGTPGTFTLNLHNPGTATAWNPTITDLLPQGAQGGMCSVAPTNVTAQIFEADGSTPFSAPLVEGTDFTVSFAGATCQWTITLMSAAGGIESNKRLIVSYDAGLDPGTVNGINLINIAGVTQWFSADTATARTYTEVLTDGTPGTLDHEDNHTVATETPGLRFQKSVRNMTTGQNPGSNARPGDTLRYTIQIINTGPVGLASFALEDEVDRLNDPAVFLAGSLTLITVPAAADSSGTSAVGGVHGTGLVRVDNLSIGPAIDTVVVEFDITLASAIDNSTVVLNQAQLDVGSPVLPNSDDPNVNGTDDPDVVGDEDPTQTLITSAPRFEIWKTSQDITGDPAVLMAGDSLRYTITVKNTGSENSVNSMLRDQIPANTAYVAGSTRLNGAPIADYGAGVSALENGTLINAPGNTTPGDMDADASATPNNVATITFNVTVNITALDGTIIANQAFLTGAGASSGSIAEQPSDDPGTAILNDPTRDVVGNLPLVDAQKTVQIVEDNGSANILDPGDVIRYTITMSNAGAIPATGVVFTDAVPFDTTYVANSVFLNGLPVGQPDGGVSPLIAGIPVSSSDLTPPLPTTGNGILSPGSSAVIIFDVQVNGGVATGTIISNQGVVSTTELPAEPSDADGIDSNGDQPTQIVVGNVQQLIISKEVFVVGGGTAEPSSQLEYVIRVANIGTLPAVNVVVTDDLGPLVGLADYVPASGLMNGSSAGVSYAGTVLTADYASQYGDLQPGGIIVVRFRVDIDSAVAIGTTITNTGDVSWNSSTQNASASVSLDVGGTPGTGIVNGHVWHDAGLDLILDSSEQALAGWSVQLYRNNVLLTTVLTDASGAYHVSGMVPNLGTPDLYELRFRAPAAGANTASLGYANSIFTNGPQRISDIIVASGNNLQNLDLPIWPNGVVYNSVSRIAVAGAKLELLNAGTGNALPSLCFDDPAQQNQLTTQNGFYKFDLNFSDASCPAGGAYLIKVTSPATGYLAAPSLIIPPTSDAATAPFSVPTCPGDAVPVPAGYCELVVSAAVPPVSELPGSPATFYHLHLTLDNGTVPGQSQIFNNPIPIDPKLDGAVAITKTSSLINASKGSLVPYTITVTNVYGVPLYNINIKDNFPAGFKYVADSARIDGTATEPLVSGRELIWDGLELQVNAKFTIQLLLVVGSGVSEGEYVNRAQVFNTITNSPASGQATATVQVVPDPDFDCTDVIGKVFDDRNLNGQQDTGDNGLAEVRVVTARGVIATTDKDGRFHITCAAVPDSDRGSNFILKLDERSLPTGYRLTTENPRVQRATRGKMLRYNFGATIHRVVRIDIADGVFEPNTSELRLQWQPKINQLIEELRKAPSVLRLSYLADVEQQSLVRKRLNALKKTISSQWDQLDGSYPLTVETEVFWRRGAPLKEQK